MARIPRTLVSLGVRTRILITVPIVLLVSILLVSYVANTVQRSQLMSHYRNHQYSLLQVVYNAIARYMIQNHREEIQTVMDQLRLGTEIKSLRIISPTGAICYSTTPGEVGIPFLDSSLTVLRSSRGDSAFSEKRISGSWQLTTIARIRNIPACYPCHAKENTYLGYLAIESDLSAVDKAIRRSQIGALYIVLISLLFAGAAVALVHIRFIKKGVRKVLSAIGEVEQGNFQTYVDIRTRDELGQLAASFNSMIQRLNQMRAELKQLYRSQIERADKMASVGEIAAGIAHEIKNPITGISSSIKVMMNDMEEDDERLPIFQEIIRQARRVDEAVNDLLTYARPKEPCLGVVDISDVVESSMKLIRDQARRNGIDVLLFSEEELPKTRADAGQIEQALVNLMVNGIQAMPNGGSLNVTLERDATVNVVIVRIADTGEGIDPEKMKDIFRPFYTTKHRGTGLGLAISRGIVKRHGGSLNVESEIGKGTAVSVFLPAVGD